MRELYDWDACAETFFPTAQELVRRACEAEKAGEKEKASELYMYEDVELAYESIRCFLIGELPLSIASPVSQPHDHQSRSLPDEEGGLFEGPSV